MKDHFIHRAEVKLREQLGGVQKHTYPLITFGYYAQYPPKELGFNIAGPEEVVTHSLVAPGNPLPKINKIPLLTEQHNNILKRE